MGMDQKELRELEARCIQEEPPRCQAACPLGLNAKALCAAVTAGNMAGAWAILTKHMPLPGVLARICDHPCEAACLRGEAGDSIRIGALERAVANSPEPRARILPMPKRQGKIAITGAGLAALSAAWDMTAKGFAVTVMTVADALGGRLREIPESLLPASAVEAEIDRLKKRGVAFETSLSPERLDPATLLSDFAAVCLGGDDLECRQSPPDGFDPLTMSCDRPGLFFCGAAPGDAPYSPIQAASQGRRAALSMDRFLQKVSLTAGRAAENQGTRLFTNISGVPALPAAPMADSQAGYSPDEARAEAGRCLQCQCLECVKACPYLEKYKAYPRVYARRMYNNAAIVKGNHSDNVLINSCMLCGLCTALCPDDFPMAGLCLDARRDLVAKGKMPPSAHEFALMDMEYSQSDACFLTRKAPDAASLKRLFFPGCQLAGTKPLAVARAYAALRDIFPGETGVMLSCCGAPARWAGREDLFSGAMVRLKAFWEDSGRPEIIAACPSCLNMIEEALPEAATVSLWEVFDQSSLTFPKAAQAEPMAVHDACAARERTSLRQSVRSLLARLEVPLEELSFSGELTKCCGFGGLLSEVDPTLAATVAERRGAESEADFAASCAMCRDQLARSGKRVLHMLDLLFPGPESDPAALAPVGFSERRDNRALLKRTLLREVFGQTPPEPEAGMVLELSPEVAALLETRRILHEDVRAVIASAEQTGKKFRHKETGHFLASRRPANATFWVEYSPAGEGFAVHNAYCHRMALKEEA